MANYRHLKGSEQTFVAIDSMPALEQPKLPTMPAIVIPHKTETSAASSQRKISRSVGSGCRAEVGCEGRPQRRVPAVDRSEIALVHKAVQALRRRGDATGALTLLVTYMQRQPDGVLFEEALALAVEAADAAGSTNAPSLARRYVPDHPLWNKGFGLQRRRTMC